MVEGVDLAVAGLADVAAARPDQRAGRSPSRPGRAAVPGSRRRSVLAHRSPWLRSQPVVGQLSRASLAASALLDRLEEPGSRHPHRDGIRVLDRQLIEPRKNASIGSKIVRVDSLITSGRHRPKSRNDRQRRRPRPLARPHNRRRPATRRFLFLVVYDERRDPKR